MLERIRWIREWGAAMNVLAFVVAVFVVQPLVLLAGLAGYWLRPRSLRIGLALGVAAVAMTVIALFVSLWTFYVAAAAGAAVGIAAIIRPRAAGAARWLAIGGTIVWLIAMNLLVLDASGVITFG